MQPKEIGSALLDDAVSQLSLLPGVGRRTALRLALHLLRQPAETADALAGSLTALRRDVKYCRECHNISDDELCPVCADRSRDRTLLCVVENIQDVLAIERTQQYNGLYHVLGGIISPMDGIGPGDIQIQSLVERVGRSQTLPEADGGRVREVVFALSGTMEGETTVFYISRQLERFAGLRMSVIARGVSVGDELQYADEVTLARSIAGRTKLQ